MSAIFVFFACLLISGLNAQSYLTNPPAKSPPGPSEVSPCGTGTYPLPYQVPAGRYLLTQWSDSTNGANDGIAQFSLLSDDENYIASLFNVTFANKQLDLRIPPETPLGIYTLQWNWKTYYSCTKLNITEDPVKATVITFDTPVNGYLKPNLTYFEIHRGLNNLQPMFITGRVTSGTLPMTMFASKGLQTIPDTTTYDEMEDTATNPEISFGTCPTQSAWFLAVLGAPEASGNDTFQFTVTSYEATANIGTPALSAAPHTGNRYYVTASSKTLLDNRRVVLRSNGNHGNPEFELTTQCYTTQGRVVGTYPASDIACIQLTDTAGNKYIRVGPMSVDYTISTENGLCKDAGVANLKASFVLVVIACIIAIFKF